MPKILALTTPEILSTVLPDWQQYNVLVEKNIAQINSIQTVDYILCLYDTPIELFMSVW